MKAYTPKFPSKRALIKEYVSVFQFANKVSGELIQANARVEALEKELAELRAKAGGTP